MEKTGETIEKVAGIVLAVDDKDGDMAAGIYDSTASSEQQMELKYSKNENFIRDRFRELVKKITFHQNDEGWYTFKDNATHLVMQIGNPP